MPRKTHPVSGLFELSPGSGVWYIRYRLDGKLVRKRIGTRQQAIDQLNKVKFIRATGEGFVARSARQLTRSKQEIIDLGSTNVTVAELADEYLVHIQDENNPDRPGDQINPPQRLGVIKGAFGERPAVTIKPYEIQDWLKSLKLAPATLNRYKSTFSSIYRYAKERGKLSVNPVRDFTQFSVPEAATRYMEPDEESRIRDVLQKWIEDCPDHHTLKKLYLRCHPLELTIGLGTGFRKGNQYKLKWTGCKFKERKIVLGKTKNGDSHSIPMIDDVYNALLELRDIQTEILEIQARTRAGGQKPPVRMVANGRVFNISENRTWWEDALNEAGIENFRWHDLRHTFCSRLSQAGKDLKVIQVAAGHKTISTTAKYAHLNNTVVSNAMTVLNRQ